MQQEVTQFVCPECGSYNVFIQPVLTMLDPPYWVCVCCRQGCKHTDRIEKFIINKISKLVTDNDSTAIN